MSTSFIKVNYRVWLNKEDFSYTYLYTYVYDPFEYVYIHVYMLLNVSHELEQADECC